MPSQVLQQRSFKLRGTSTQWMEAREGDTWNQKALRVSRLYPLLIVLPILQFSVLLRLNFSFPSIFSFSFSGGRQDSHGIDIGLVPYTFIPLKFVGYPSNLNCGGVPVVVFYWPIQTFTMLKLLYSNFTPPEPFRACDVIFCHIDLLDFIRGRSKAPFFSCSVFGLLYPSTSNVDAALSLTPSLHLYQHGFCRRWGELVGQWW